MQDLEQRKRQLAFGKQNYRLMLAGVFIILLGLYIMTLDNTTFGFGFIGLTLGPVITFIGFLVPFVAIFYPKPKQ